MKIFIFILACLLIFVNNYAQPGYPPDKYVNLDDIPDSAEIVYTSFVHPSNIYGGYQIYYFIDSSTTKFKNLSLLKEITLDLNFIPQEMIDFGQNIEILKMRSNHYKMSNNIENAQLHDTIKNLLLLNKLPNLTTVYISGFYIDEENQLVNNELRIAQSNNQSRFFSFVDVEILNISEHVLCTKLYLHTTKISNIKGLVQNTFIKEMYLSKLNFIKLPENLPPSLEKLEVSNCDSLTDISNLSEYPKLSSFIIHTGSKIKQFPKKLQSEIFSTIEIDYIRPERVVEFMEFISNAKTIEWLKIGTCRGEGIGKIDVDFRNNKVTIGTLDINGNCFDSRAPIQLNGIDSLSVTNLYLNGVFDEIPAFSKIKDLRKLYFGSCYPMNKETMEELFKLKNLSEFRISNIKVNVIPERFFKNNTSLVSLSIVGSEIKNLSFHNCILINLRHFHIAGNMNLEKIPKKMYYPNAYLNLYGNKKEKYTN
ncbi:MAG: hypothetical protein Q8M29_09965 [Bacteroidota bacterium]|nr:hypothetical protein [Bacteroidota bacterium]